MDFKGLVREIVFDATYYSTINMDEDDIEAITKKITDAHEVEMEARCSDCEDKIKRPNQ